MDRIIPNIEWCREISSQLGVATRCPFSTVDECPRYYQSLSLLKSAGHTSIPPEKDALLLKKWKRHSLWPAIEEQATSVSGSPGGRKTFSKFCPEVAYDRFGFFASELYPYHNELDQDNGIKIGKREGLPDGHWVSNWSYVEKIHYTDCPIYSPLKAIGSSQNSEKSLPDKLLARFRNNPLIATLITISIIIVGIGTFTDALVKIQTGIEKFFQRSDVSTNKATTNLIPVQPGTIIAAHYPTGELYAVDPKAGTIQLLSARLGNLRGMAINADGTIIVLSSDGKLLRNPQNGSTLGYANRITAIKSKNGYQSTIGTFLWPSVSQSISLDSGTSVLVALDGAIIRINIESGEATTIVYDDLLKNASGVVRMPSGEILVTAIPDKILTIEVGGSINILSQGGKLWHPRAPVVETDRSIIVGTAGENASVLRVNTKTGEQELVATGPFTTIAGLAIENDGSIIVADNGHGSPGDGFIARVDPLSRIVNILVSAQNSNWKFLNGRSVAVMPKKSSL